MAKNTGNLNAGTDSLALARQDLYDMAKDMGYKETGDVSPISVTGGNNKIVKTDASGNARLTGRLEAEGIIQTSGTQILLLRDANPNYIYSKGSAGVSLKIAVGNTTNAGDSTVATFEEGGNLAITGTYSPFTGTHIATSNEDLKIGEVVKIKSVGFEEKDEKQPIWEASYATENENGIFGIVYSKKDIYEELITIEKEENKEGVLVDVEVITNGEFIEIKHYIACLGDMFAFVDESENIEYGDFLTVSNIQGKVRKYTGADLRKVIGRAGQDYSIGDSAKIAITKE